MRAAHQQVQTADSKQDLLLCAPDEIRTHTVYQLVIVAVRRLLARFLMGNKPERLEKPVGQIYGITYQVIPSIWIPRRQIS
jgi:hypothetical protein